MSSLALISFCCVLGAVLWALWAGKAGMQQEYRDGAQGFADLLRYATPVADGVLLGNGGELIAGFYYRGMDTESATNDQRRGADG